MTDVVSSGSLILALPLAILAGLVSFLSPCVLPLAPGYLSYMTGLTSSQLANDNNVLVTERRRRRIAVLAGTGLFVLGFSAVFISYGALFGGAGAVLLEYQDPITRAMGVIVILLGAGYLLGWSPLQREWRLHRRPTGGLWGAPLLGFVFGLGWAPCIGPILAVVQTMAFTQASAARGATLSLAYCIGLGLPFLGLGLAYEQATAAIGALRRHSRLLTQISGIAMILIGLLLVSGAWSQVTIWMRVQSGSFQLPL